MKSTLSLVAVSVLVLSGCATKEYVHEYVQAQLNPVTTRVSAVETRAGALEGRAGSADTAIQANTLAIAETGKRVDEVQATLKVHADRIGKNETDIAQLSKTAQDAVERANAAGKLAKGKLVYEVILSDDKLKFGPNKSKLGKDAESALDAFAAKLKGDNNNVFIEIQGHTDSIGEAAHNLKLGEARAEAVRRYLNMRGGIPLHRMAVISYGETAPVADNKVKAGRQENRRVVLVVIQ
jgi:outer membrane protein OmpA-like peptidoglycan-associated protein